MARAAHALSVSAFLVALAVGAGAQCAFAPYNIPNQTVDGFDVVVNGPKTAAYRAPGAPAAAYAVESTMNELAELLERAGDGVYVTDVAGLHSGVNPVSGSFSVGASGRLIEGGELAAPVREFTIASDLVSMLKAVAATGGEPRLVPFGGSVRTPHLLISQMTVSGS